MPHGKATQFNFRLDAELKKAAERAARADTRTLSSLIVKLLTEHCRENGFLKPERGART
jgi:hypothetical protein